MSNTQDILNILLGLGFFIIVLCITIITYYLVRVLKSLMNLIESLESTAQSVKEKMQIKFLAAIPALMITLIRKIFSRGR